MHTPSAADEAAYKTIILADQEAREALGRRPVVDEQIAAVGALGLLLGCVAGWISESEPA